MTISMIISPISDEPIICYTISAELVSLYGVLDALFNDSTI